jgi:glycosyltransferase involved in cell wall biosynthesis
MIPVSVIVVIKNEEKNIAHCLSALNRFEDVWVIDSNSQDKTAEIAKSFPVTVQNFQWTGQYPKKRQFCLDTLPLKYDWVLFIDADEIIPDTLINEIQKKLLTHPAEAGFFIIGKYRLDKIILRFGLHNKKISLLHRGRMEYPIVDDLDIPGMGEIEGHYQPVLKASAKHLKIGYLEHFIIHDGLVDERAWGFRHQKYARWESGMNAKGAWPRDPIGWRERIKSYLRRSKYRAEIVFVSGYFLKLGVLDGRNGLFWAKQRYKYLKNIKEM